MKLRNRQKLYTGILLVTVISMFFVFGMDLPQIAGTPNVCEDPDRPSEPVPELPGGGSLQDCLPDPGS